MSWRFLLPRWGVLSSMYSIATDASGRFRTLQDAPGSSLELLKAPVSLCRLSGPKTTFRPRRAPRSQKTTFRSQRAPRRARNFLGCSKTAALTGGAGMAGCVAFFYPFNFLQRSREFSFNGHLTLRPVAPNCAQLRPVAPSCAKLRPVAPSCVQLRQVAPNCA